MSLPIWDKEKIKTILPQREPFLFIDEVTEIEEGRRIVATRYIDPNEYFFKGHFPGKPIMPGVLIIEAMAQASILLYSVVKPEIAKSAPNYYLGRVKAEFMSPVYPGDMLTLEAKNIKIIDSGGLIDVEARVKDKLIAKCSSTFAVKKND